MMQTQLLQIIAQRVSNNPHQAPPIDKRVEFKKGPNAQGAIWSLDMLSSTHLEELINLIRKVVPRGCISLKGFIIQSKHPLLGW